MAERKVQSKYIPADYDPKVLQRLGRQEKKARARREGGGGGPQLEPSRIGLPFNVSCEACGAYMYRGRKFNAGKESGADPDYLGIKVYRFHFKCENCSGEIVFRTNPRTSGFDMVSGGRETSTSKGRFNALEGVKEKDEEDPDGKPDALTLLEQRALESKKEMAMIEELEDALERSQARHRALRAGALGSSAGPDSHQGETKVDEEDRDAARVAFARKRLEAADPFAASSAPVQLESRPEEFKRIKVAVAARETAPAPAPATKPAASLVPYGDDEDEDEDG